MNKYKENTILSILFMKKKKTYRKELRQGYIIYLNRFNNFYEKFI